VCSTMDAGTGMTASLEGWRRSWYCTRQPAVLSEPPYSVVRAEGINPASGRTAHTRDRRGSLSRCPATMLGLCTYRSSALIRAAGSHRPIRAESEGESAKQIHIKGARFHPGPLPFHPPEVNHGIRITVESGTSDPAVFGRLIRS
jgi:hypothetical protein